MNEINMGDLLFPGFSQKKGKASCMAPVNFWNVEEPQLQDVIRLLHRDGGWGNSTSHGGLTGSGGLVR